MRSYRLHIFWWKKFDTDRAIFPLISINEHYCAISQNLFWLLFLNRIIFLKFHFTNVNLFMFFRLWAKYYRKIPLGKVVFQILVTWLFLRNKNSFIGSHFEMKHFFCSFCWYMVILVSNKNSYGEVLKNEWVQVDPPPLCTNGSEKYLIRHWSVKPCFIECVAVFLNHRLCWCTCLLVPTICYVWW